MTTLNFPASPTVGQTYTLNNRTWSWDGTTWVATAGAAAPAIMKLGQVVCVGGETTITFANIPQNFTDLRISFSGRDTASGSGSLAARIKFNGDSTAADYTSPQWIEGAAGATASTDAATSAGQICSLIPGTSGNANALGISTIEIPSYASTAFYKIWQAHGGEWYSATAYDARFGVWQSTAAITSITLTAGGAAFAAGTTATLYGLGGTASSIVNGVAEQTTAPVNPISGQLWWKSDEGNLKIWYGGAWVDASTLGADPSQCNGRLTLTSGTPITTSDVTGATTIYFTPYKGGRIALFDGTSVWTALPFSETSLALGTLVSATNYDVFAYNNNGTLALEIGPAWSSNTARATALVLQDGVYVKSGATTRRYLGTFRTTSTTTTEDSGGGVTTQVGGKRFLWNMCNRVDRPMSVFDSTNAWSYITGAWRQKNAAAGNKVEFVVGLSEDAIEALSTEAVQVAQNTRDALVSIGVDSVTVPSATIGQGSWGSTGVFDMSMSSKYVGFPGAGYHYLAELEYGADNVCYFLGSLRSGRTGLTGRVMA
jgi:hypothetical protein